MRFHASSPGLRPPEAVLPRAFMLGPYGAFTIVEELLYFSKDKLGSKGLNEVALFVFTTMNRMGRKVVIPSCLSRSSRQKFLFFARFAPALV